MIGIIQAHTDNLCLPQCCNARRSISALPHRIATRAGDKVSAGALLAQLFRIAAGEITGIRKCDYLLVPFAQMEIACSVQEDRLNMISAIPSTSPARSCLYVCNYCFTAKSSLRLDVENRKTAHWLSQLAMTCFWTFRWRTICWMR